MKFVVAILAVLILGGGALAAATHVLADRRDTTYYRWFARVLEPVGRLWLPAGRALTPLPFADDFSGAELDPAWRRFRTEDVRFWLADGALVGETVRESVWWHNQRTTMFSRLVAGDVDLRVNVRTRKASDPQSYPDSNWQFGGLILRDPAGDGWFGLENYVFNVVGHRGSGLQIETKSTLKGESLLRSIDWPSGDAGLRIVRRGGHFSLFARQGEGEWLPVTDYQRRDLPEQLEAGLILYSASAGTGFHDLRVLFDGFLIGTPP